ncbi:MAG: hypothetical protein WCI30_01210 [Clostridia bacterium]
MFPLTHLYFTKKIELNLNPALCIGSCLPDILVSCGMDWKVAHEDLLPLSLPKDIQRACLYHGTNPAHPGLDYYCDKDYKNYGCGFAFYHACNFTNALALLAIPTEDLLWRGHNIIEMACEIIIAAKNPELLAEFQLAKKDNNLKSSIYQALAPKLYVSEKHFFLVVDKFMDMQGTSKDLLYGFIKKLNKSYQSSYLITDFSPILAQAVELMQALCLPFIDECLELVEKN